MSKQRSLTPENVDRMLVLVDAKADRSLAKIGREEKIKVVRVASEQVKRILEAETGAEERRKVAQQLLRVSDRPDDVGALPASPAQEVDIS